MSILDILTYPNTFLSRPTATVENIDGNLQKIIVNMAETMYAAPGMGLAANQVGLNKSLLIYDLSPSEEKRRIEVLINPTIVSKEGMMTSQNEGCLSVPDFRVDVKRSASIFIEGVDGDGKPIEIEAEGLLAIVLQHEIDHLKGTLFIDRISALKRELFKRRIKKQLKQKYE